MWSEITYPGKARVVSFVLAKWHLWDEIMWINKSPSAQKPLAEGAFV